MTPSKDRALDAAIDLLGTRGLRALTHARVDERAGLPRGSTSNYFRTRAALLSGVVAGIVERELDRLGAAGSPSSVEELVDALCGLIAYTTGTHRTLTAARLVLFVEAGHDPTLRAALSRGHTALEEWTVAVLTRLGAPDPWAAAAAIMACGEGLVLHRIALHDGRDARSAVDLVVRAALNRGSG